MFSTLPLVAIVKIVHTIRGVSKNGNDYIDLSTAKKIRSAAVALAWQSQPTGRMGETNNKKIIHEPTKTKERKEILCWQLM
jgi:hypothetical protein